MTPALAENETATAAADRLDTPACSRCGRKTRIYGIEPHTQKQRTDVYTYVCDGCETVEVRVVPVPA